MPAARGGNLEPLPPEEFRRLLTRAQPDFGLSLEEGVVAQLGTFLAELDRWRRTVNLTGRLSAAELVSHTLESVLGEPLLPRGARAVDVGAGGGFPGVPLAICRPDLAFTWLEPREKRAAFLRHVARVIPVANAEVRAGRLQDLDVSPFDFATVRGVRLDGRLLGEAEFLRPGGGLLAWTTRADNLALALAPSGFEVDQTIPIPGSRQRVIALFRRA